MFPEYIGLTGPVIQALGWALIHFLWQGALVGALFAAGMLVLKGATPNSRYLYGLGCLVALAASPLITFWAMYQPGVQGVVTPLASTLAAVASGGSEPVAAAVAIEAALPWVVMAWICGVALLSIRVMVNWRRMRRLVRFGVAPAPSSVLESTRALCELLGIRRAVMVLESSIVKVPTVLGWLKPVILLPTSSLVGLTPAQLELVIAHELGHVRRLDYLVNLAQVVVETTLFYHPVVGWISRRVRDEREKCCDDLVIRTCGNRLEYAKALSNLETIRSGSGLPALAATDGQLVQRIERIVCNHAARPREAMAGSTLIMMTLALAIIIAGQVSDPMAHLDQQRSLLADALVADWQPTIADQTSTEFVSLESVSAAPIPLVEAPRQVESVVAESAPPIVSPTVSPESVDRPLVSESRPAAVITHMQTEQTTPGKSQGTAVEVSLDTARIESVDVLATPMIAPPAARTADVPSVSRSAELPSQPAGPVAIHKAAPDYPVRARLAGQQGVVVVEFSIRSDGLPTDIKVVDAEPRRVFDKAARRAIRNWRFDAATSASYQGQRFTQEFEFSLNHASPLIGGERSCIPVTGTRICRSDSPTALLSQEAASG